MGYPYSIPKGDYRRAFRKVGGQFGVDFTYADVEITSLHMREKVEVMIADAEFAIFDVTSWNANVALELGIAMGCGQEYYVLFNPRDGRADVPSDLGGIDRMQYTSFVELEYELGRLLRQQFGAPITERHAQAKERGADVTSLLGMVADEVPVLVRRDPGLAIGDIASRMGIPIEIAKCLVRQLVLDQRLLAIGIKRGTKYYPLE